MGYREELKKAILIASGILDYKLKDLIYRNMCEPDKYYTIVKEGEDFILHKHNCLWTSKPYKSVASLIIYYKSNEEIVWHYKDCPISDKEISTIIWIT